jgi:hypothetical protein
MQGSVKTAAQWKAFYAAERASLGAPGLGELVDRAARADLPPGGALLFPHTMLAVTGHLTAAVALAVARSGADEVLALGVLHGGRDEDADEVRRAKGGDATARQSLRKVYGGADALCAEEFSLDGFVALLDVASAREGRKAPRVHAHYPFLVGDDPAVLPGVDELAALAARMPIVATTDPIHHGVGYGTAEGLARPEGDEATITWARACIGEQLDLLGSGQWGAFARLAAEVRSDFRDVGPVLGHVLRAGGVPRGEILELRLVDYAGVLGAPSPSWVAGPLMRVSRT